MRAMLEGINLTCRRGERILFRDVNCAVAAGEAVHICGANGVGKTSLLQILAGLHRPMRGEVLWHGKPIARQREDFCTALAYLGHAGGLHGDLTARENLAAAVALAGPPPHATNETTTTDCITEALQRFEVAAGEVCRALSAGQRQRVALARVWLRRGGLWLLDEPATALDADGVGMLEAMINAHLGGGGAVVFVSHRELNLSAAVKQLNLHSFHP